MRVSDVSACNFESVSAGAMMIVGAIRRDAAARLALGPATLLMATEAWVKRAARVQARVYVCEALGRKEEVAWCDPLAERKGGDECCDGRDDV